MKDCRVDKKITPAQCRAARALLGLNQRDFAPLAGVARKTLADFECGDTRPYRRAMAGIIGAFEVKGVEFISGNDGGPGLRLKE